MSEYLYLPHASENMQSIWIHNHLTQSCPTGLHNDVDVLYLHCIIW